MMLKKIIFSLTMMLLWGGLSLPATASGRFSADAAHFTLDGEPYVIKAAELHYPRIPRPYWEHRIEMCKALGMNTICLYVFWNVHESQPDEFDFSGQNDLRHFVELCRDKGMNVILRPGPYVCAEWEMGGLPWWLLRKKDIRLRENDPYFLERVEKFQRRVADEVSDLTADKGGPIIMIQVENEYGAYGIDKEYMGNIRDLVRKNFGDDVVLFQCDWSSNFLDNGLPDLLWTVNFGTGADIDSQFEGLKKERPGRPLMCSEYWSGWFDKWGANHETRPADEMTAGIDEMLSKGISFSLYMTHGGTNWGHWAGANSPGFSPDVTSYDYDAPINEQGRATPKYMQLRETLAKYCGAEDLPDLPEAVDTMSVQPFRLSEFAPIAENLPHPIVSDRVLSMEECGQGFGSILYRTKLPAIEAGDTLTLREAHDYAQIFVDDKYIGSLDRRLGESSIVLPECAEGSTLDILIEAMGRINFGRAIKDFKGLTEAAILSRASDNDQESLKGWTIFNLEDSYPTYEGMTFKSLSEATRDERGRLPRGAYRGSFNLTRTADTFLNFESWGKGLVYVNGHALGRIWGIGPQQTLYMPGCWLREGDNEILVFDIMGPEEAQVYGLSEPVLNHLRLSESKLKAQTEILNLEGEKAVLDTAFTTNSGWQEVRLSEPAEGRYVCLEILSSHDGKDYAAVSELYLTDAEGQRLPREKWVATYADSEDRDGGNHSADKMFDLQESTYWAPEAGAGLPTRVVIDLGEVKTVGGIQYLPRAESGAPGAVKRFRLYAKTVKY